MFCFVLSGFFSRRFGLARALVNRDDHISFNILDVWTAGTSAVLFDLICLACLLDGRRRADALDSSV